MMPRTWISGADGYSHPLTAWSASQRAEVPWEDISAEDHEYAASFIIRFMDTYEVVCITVEGDEEDPDSLPEEGRLVLAHQEAARRLKEARAPD
jgi:hypothetical protein